MRREREEAGAEAASKAQERRAAWARASAAGEDALDEDLWQVRSGVDEHSRLGLKALAEELGDIADELLARPEAQALSAGSRAVALRWILRGLAPGTALRKAVIDEEISVMARRGR